MTLTNQISIPVSEDAAKGAAVYTKFLLYIYDAYVLKFELPFVFKCNSRKILKFYDLHISNPHLDVGVGTGYFLDKCNFPDSNPVLHLMDLNLNSLNKTTRRIRRYKPVIHQWNVLEPYPNEIIKFNSISIGNLIHCLPGTIKDKEIVFQNLKKLLNPRGIIFGVTILGKDIHIGPLYKFTNGTYNKSSIFSNLDDSKNGLKKILSDNFNNFSLEIIGSMAFFTGRI